jgi:glyoxylase-like metal-dependent hydrolase (beta-lactamase superfamily II)
MPLPFERFKLRPHRPHRLAAFVLCCVVFTALSARAQNSPSPSTPSWCGEYRAAFAHLERVPSPDPWFEVYKVAPDTFAIYEARQSEEAISYLILGADRAAMFDTGLGIGNIRKVAESLTHLPITVVNSHTHNDHVGGNWQFGSIDGMDTAFTRASAKGSTADAQAELAPGNICGSLPPGFDVKNYSTRAWRITRRIHDGDKIALGGRTLEVIATPGHTPDSICLLDSANGLLFTGDTFYPGTIWLYRPETDLNAYAHSIQRLAALAPHLRMLFCAHNSPVANPAVLPQLVTAFAQVRAGKIPSTPAGPGKVIYRVGRISFLMAPASVTAPHASDFGINLRAGLIGIEVAQALSLCAVDFVGALRPGSPNADL